MIITSADSATFLKFNHTVCLILSISQLAKPALVALFLGVILSFFLYFRGKKQ